MFLAFLLAAFAEPVPVAPASEAAVDAFIAALPPAKSRSKSDDEQWDKDTLLRLEQTNAGHETEVRSAYAKLKECENSARRQAVDNALRSSARRLGSAKLDRMTAFYKGADYPVFDRLSQKPRTELSAAEQSELERIRSAYPLMDYAQASEAVAQEMWSDDGFAGSLFKCQDAFQADLEKRGLKP